MRFNLTEDAVIVDAEIILLSAKNYKPYLDAVIDLEYEAAEYLHELDPIDIDPYQSKKELKDWRRKTITKPKSQYKVYIAKVGTAVIGTTTLRFSTESSGKIVWGTGLAIDASYRGKGYGKQLLAGIMKDCEKDKIEHVFLTVLTNNAAAIKLYESIGFVEHAKTMTLSL